MTQPLAQGLQKWWPALLVVIVLLTIILALFQRWNINQLTSHPNPARDYDEAVQRIQAMQAGEGNLNPLCQTQFFTHGAQTDRTIILVHGYTTCPQQLAELGKRFYALGYNVLIAPLPHHGLADRMTDEQSKIKAEEFVTYADKVVDIAHGLGKHITISGISLGGVISGWAVQNRSDIDLAVIISPGFSFKDIPNGLANPIANIFMLLPTTYDWWNPALKEGGGPLYAYPRFSKHALGEIIRLGYGVEAQVEQAAPLGKAIIIVTNANDISVDNVTTAQVIKTWQAHGASLSTYEFDKNLALPHDMVDPNETGAQIELVYAKLIELINSKSIIAP
jgi:esterase/lipase